MVFKRFVGSEFALIFSVASGAQEARTQADVPREILSEGFSAVNDELCGKVGDGVNQAAHLISASASIPSSNFSPLMTFGNWF